MKRVFFLSEKHAVKKGGRLQLFGRGSADSRKTCHLSGLAWHQMIEDQVQHLPEQLKRASSSSN